MRYIVRHENHDNDFTPGLTVHPSTPMKGEAYVGHNVELEQRVLQHGGPDKAQVEEGQVAARALCFGHAGRRRGAGQRQAETEVRTGRAPAVGLIGKARTSGGGKSAAHGGELGGASCIHRPPRRASIRARPMSISSCARPRYPRNRRYPGRWSHRRRSQPRIRRRSSRLSIAPWRYRTSPGTLFTATGTQQRPSAPAIFSQGSPFHSGRTRNPQRPRTAALAKLTDNGTDGAGVAQAGRHGCGALDGRVGSGRARDAGGFDRLASVRAVCSKRAHWVIAVNMQLHGRSRQRSSCKDEISAVHAKIVPRTRAAGRSVAVRSRLAG